MNMPLYRCDLQPVLGDAGNRGLWYSRFFNSYAGDWTIPDDGKRQWVSDNAKRTGQQEMLQMAALRQLNLITALNGRGSVFKTDWHFATGLGLPHPVENGLAWHRTLGVPYLAGSGVKGLVKAWVEVWDESQSDDETRKKRCDDWFGTTEKAGNFIFFDALPIEPVLLTPDVMTPHMAKWYEQGGKISDWQKEPDKVPADWHAPVPVPFLVVKEAKLLFGIAPRTEKSADQLPKVFEALKQALEWLGAGAKTAVGYGRMVEDPSKTAHLTEEISKVAAKAEISKLSPEQQELRALHERFAADQKRGVREAGGELIGKTNQLLKEGLNWPVADRQALATLVEAIFSYIGWGNKKKERKEKIAALRG